MSDYTPTEGHGSLHKNDKGGVDKRPDMRGECMVGGVLYRVSAWTRDGKRGRFLSLSIQPAEQKPTAPSAPSADPLDDVLGGPAEPPAATTPPPAGSQDEMPF